MKQFLWQIAKWVYRKAQLILSGVIATGYFSAKTIEKGERTVGPYVITKF